jgi:hypothetical protein
MARRFYRACVFVVEGRSELESTGRPFPLLHMRLPAPKRPHQTGAIGKVQDQQETALRVGSVGPPLFRGNRGWITSQSSSGTKALLMTIPVS